MDLYVESSYRVSELIMKKYSTSFSSSTRLFAPDIRRDIYAIYGLVRIADEVVDSHKGDDAETILNELQKDVSRGLQRGYSTNPVVEAFVVTATKYGIDASLVDPFFTSMAMDLRPITYTDAVYKTYIYGSAEVVGLMCLKVFCQSDDGLYRKLKKGAQALGAAYQKVNFLRDMAADYKELGRVYFPGVTFETFSETDKQHIIVDIEKDFSLAKQAVVRLPRNSQRAVRVSVVYYEALLEKLKRTSSETIKLRRTRINNFRKVTLLLTSTTGLNRGS